MSNYGLKISLPGYDVHTATPEQCSLHSGYSTLKAQTDKTPPHIGTYHVDFTSGITQNHTYTAYTIPHGYDYTPLCLSSISLYSTGIGTPSNILTGVGTLGVGATLAIIATCDATNFYITVFDNFNWITTGATIDVGYYIFAESPT